MNKKLIALAVAGATFAPAAMAQAANPVTLYGRAYLTLDSVKADGVSARQRVSDQASLLGVRGTEDLGGGLKAFFQLETGFALDQESTTFATRNSGVGLQGGFGTIMAGRWDTPMKLAITATDPWGDLTIADVNGVTMDQGNFSRRQSNVVQYWSPSMSGFSVRLQYAANEGRSPPPTGAASNPEGYGASLTYSKGPLYLAYAYEEHKDGLVAGPAAAGTAGTKAEGNAVAARYTLGKVRLMGSYGEYKKSSGTKDKSYHLGSDWNVSGKHVLIATYASAKEGAGKCDAFSLGYRYDFTTRTFFTAGYTEVDNENGMNCNFGSSSLSGGTEKKGGFVGVRHVF